MKKDNGVSFIDVKVTYKHDKFTTSFYHKPTVSRRHFTVVILQFFTIHIQNVHDSYIAM